MRPLARELSACALLLWLGSTPAAAVEHEVTFQNGAVTLAATLTLPAGPGPHPAVVFLHGSGPVTRAGAAPYAERFATIGLAGLRFDKRGTGASSGSWTGASLEDLARDGAAAIAYLATRPEIDPGRIGFWGVSQAGWVAVRALAVTDRIAFMVIISGGGVSPHESEIFSYRAALEHAGFAESEIAEALETVELYMRYLGTGEGREDAAAAIEASKAKAWYPNVRLDAIFPESEEGRKKWSWVATWDPAPLAELIRFPVLVMFGGRDRQAPAAASVAAWREALDRAGNTRYRIELFPEAGHGIRVWSDGHHDGERPPFADGYERIMLDWLTENVVAAGR